MTADRATRSEDVVAGAYEDAGFQTWRPPKAKYREQDVFGLFDVVAAHPARPLRLIQVKTGQARYPAEWEEQTRQTVPLNGETGRVHAEYAIVHPGEGVELRTLGPDGLVVVVDERDCGNPPGDVVTDYLRNSVADREAVEE